MNTKIYVVRFVRFTLVDVLGKGEMQVAPGGGHLAVVHRAPNMNIGPLTNGDWRIRVYALGPDHVSAQLVDEVERDDHFIHSVDFSPAGEYIYWTETGKTSTNKYSMGSMRRAVHRFPRSRAYETWWFNEPCAPPTERHGA